MSDVDPGLRREIVAWWSPRMGNGDAHRPLRHLGPALLLFPTAAGDFLEAERMGLIRSIEPLLFAGR